MDYNLLTNLGVVGFLAYFFIEKFFGWLPKPNFFNSGRSTAKTQQDIDIALLQQAQKTLESNHLVHQVAIEKWMEKHDKEHSADRALLLQVALKMHVDLKNVQDI